MSWLARLIGPAKSRQPVSREEDAGALAGAESDIDVSIPDVRPAEDLTDKAVQAETALTIGGEVAEPAEAVPTLVLSLSLGSGARPERHFGPGWSRPERDFTWGVGKESVLFLDIFLSRVDHILELDLKPHIQKEALPQQRLTVVFEENDIATASLMADVTLQCLIPRALIRPDLPAVVTLRHPDFRPPAEVSKTNKDGRPLGVAVKQVRVFALSGSAQGYP